MARGVAIGKEARRPASAGLRRILLRPELTAVVATVAVFIYFATTAGNDGFLSLLGTRNYLEIGSYIGIIAAPVTLLLVAGEFDLSVGSMVAVGQIVVAYGAVFLHWPLWASVLSALLVGCSLGAFNGLVVVKTGLPSFIVTLAALFAIRGLVQGLALATTGSSTIGAVWEALRNDPLLSAFRGVALGLPVGVFWWVGVTLVTAWLLDRTKFGNWIYASGGNLDSALKRGVPVERVKVFLYMSTAAASTLVGALSMLAINQADVNAAMGREFEVVTASVIGGALLTGGYGSPIGAAFGSLLFGMVVQGFFFTNIPDQWYQVFLGAMLLIAVLVNKYVRQLALRPLRRP